ncbi:hypothetical protein [Chryseobacterium culicis]|jgi:hypothetical protein|uniref:hypothetical protein n=1 Tax=Chryseobacterium culicis TaxID=680127 RepID=UPI00187602B7|nr:hypothetical protein [Chryseobacterium culicis]MBE4949443.1 hypothetical protein [Chryseobacterium culicis]
MRKKRQIVMAVGILLVMLPQILKSWISIPDLYSSLIVGIGLGLELLAIIKIVKEKRMRNLK